VTELRQYGRSPSGECWRGGPLLSWRAGLVMTHHHHPWTGRKVSANFARPTFWGTSCRLKVAESRGALDGTRHAKDISHDDDDTDHGGHDDHQDDDHWICI